MKIVILNDGETWDVLEGCRIATVTDEQLVQLDEGHISVSDLPTLVRFTNRR